MDFFWNFVKIFLSAGIGFFAGRHFQVGLSKLWMANKCAACKHFFAISPIYENKHIHWEIRWIPETQDWYVECSDNRNNKGAGKSSSITEAIESSLGEFNRNWK